jgi:hypothetical protein
MKPRSTLATLALGVALSVGCAPAAAQDTLVVRIEDRPEWGDNPRVVEWMRIGVLEGDEAYTFGSVSDVALGESNEVWVADSQSRSIRRFDEHGHAMDAVGREGEGPGEFKNLQALERFPDKSMVTWDPGLFRVSIFNPDGSFLRSFPVPTGQMVGSPQAFRAGDDSTVYVLVLANFLEDRENYYPQWIHVDMDGQVLDTLDGLPSRREGPLAFSTRTTYAISGQGYVVQGRTDRWAVSRPLPGGRPLRIERPYQPIPFGSLERREADAREKFFAEKRWGIQAQPIPRTKPVFRELEVDQEGRIWMRLHAPAIRIPMTPGEEAGLERAQEMFGADDAPPPQEWRERAVYDVVEPDGTYLGRVELPYWNSRLVAARGRDVWVVQTGEYGENYVVQYRIEKGN